MSEQKAGEKEAEEEGGDIEGDLNDAKEAAKEGTIDAVDLILWDPWALEAEREAAIGAVERDSSAL